MPRETDSTTKFKADISQLKAAMQEASRAVRLASSEFKAATAGMDDWSKTADGLSAKTKQLNSTLDAQKKQLRSLEEQYRLTVQEQGENSKGAEELAIKINNQKAAIKNTEASLNEYEKALDDVQSAEEDAGESAQKASDGFTVMKGALASLVADGVRAAISGLKDFASEAYAAGANFQSAMSQVGAVSGANGEEIEALTAKAEEMGAKTKFSATESAEAFNYMAMAGWKTEEMLGGIEGIMNLAAASGADLATTSDIVTDALTAFGKSAQDASQLADIMAAASSNANTNVEMMGETFKYVAPVAGAMGYSMEDTAVAIGLMANAGIKASQGGTALRSIINRLVAPTKESGTAMDRLGLSITDSEGNMKSLSQIMQDLRKSMRGLSQDEQASLAKHLAGQEAMSGLLAIVNASETDFNKLTLAINNSSGAAQNMADTMNDNVNGAITLLKSQIEGIMIKLFDRASASMRKGINSVSEALDTVDWDKIGDGVGKFAEKAADLFAYVLTHGSSIISILTTIAGVTTALFAVNKIGAFIGWLNSLIRTYTSLNAVMTALKGTQLALNAAQLASPLGLTIGLLGGLAAAFIAASEKMEADAKAAYGLTEAEKELNAEIKNSFEAQKQLNEQREDSIKATTGEFNYIRSLKDEYNGLIDKNGEVKKGYEDRANFIVDQLAQALGIEVSEVQKLIDKNGELGKSIDELILKKQAEATLSAYDDSYKKALQGQRDALDNVIEAQNNYTQSEKEVTEVQAKYNDALTKLDDEVAKYGRDAHGYSTTVGELNLQLQEAKTTFEENKKAVEQANQAYSDSQTTIQNYEGLASAIRSNDINSINTWVTNLTNGYKDASSATEEELKQQVKDFENYYNDIKAAMDAGNPVITQKMVDDAELMMNRAKAELEKGVPYFDDVAKASKSAYVKGLSDNNGGVQAAAKNTVKAAKDGADKQAKTLTSSGASSGKAFNQGIESEAKNSGASAKKLTTSANKALSSNEAKKSAEKSGKNFGLGFANGITLPEVFGKIGNAVKKLVQSALSKLKKEQQEGSPSKLTAVSGKFFGLGYEVGINATQKVVGQAAANLAKTALQSLSEAQQSGSPSTLTFESGKQFTQNFIEGMVSLDHSVIRTAQSTVKTVVKELLNLDNFNFSKVAENASGVFSKALSKRLSYTTERINYENKEKLEEFDKTIEELQKEQEKALADAENASESEQERLQQQIEKLESKKESKKRKKKIKKYQQELEDEKKSIAERTKTIQESYQKQIAEQQKMKDAYQNASQKLIQEFSSAMSEYQTAAQKLIDDTMNGITSTYNSRYNALISKQNNLIDKLKSAGDLFNVSGANVMTVNDLKAQTEQIKQYTSKLKTIKDKVSSDLFDQIASYDMQQGEAFIDRLLALSDAELKAYDRAYSEKMNLAEQLSEDIYKSDFDQVADDYEGAIREAFKGLPDQLERLGYQTMKGFTDGLTQDTDYMKGQVKLFIDAMVDIFRDELGIHSPSKVTTALGAFTGEGFANGLKDTLKGIKKVVQDITNSVTDTLDFGNMGGIKSLVDDYSGNSTNGVHGANNAPTTQVINFNQTNNSPKALDRLTIYRQTNNMLFGAKVRLSDV